jgi:hypothetical protein
MEVEFDRVEDGMIQYKCTDTNGRVYGVADTIQEGMIMDTIVIDMDTYDEVDDSELFKRIVTARAIYLDDSYEALEAMKELY